MPSLNHCLVDLVPTNSHDLQSLGEDSLHTICECNISDTGYSNRTLVHHSSATRYTFSAPEYPIVPDNGRQSSEPPTYDKTACAEVIRCAYTERFLNFPKAKGLLAKPIRISSRDDYQRKWLRFGTYVKDKKHTCNSDKSWSFLGFVKHIFHDIKLPWNHCPL